MRLGSLWRLVLIQFVGAVLDLLNLPLEGFEFVWKENVEAELICHPFFAAIVECVSEVLMRNGLRLRRQTMIGTRGSTTPPVDEKLKGQVNYQAEVQVHSLFPTCVVYLSRYTSVRRIL